MPGTDEEIGFQRLPDPVDDGVAEAADHHRDRDHHRQAHRQRRDRNRQARNRRRQVGVREQAFDAEPPPQERAARGAPANT
jgi:hypothetical protein